MFRFFRSGSTLACCAVLATVAGATAIACSSFSAGGTADAADAGDEAASADGAVLPRCNWICDNFDRADGGEPHGGEPQASWAQPAVRGGGTIGLSDAAPFSPPRAVEAFLPAGNVIVLALLANTYLESFTALHCEAQIFVKSQGPETVTFLSLTVVAANDEKHTLVLQAQPGTVIFREDSAVDTNLPALPSAYQRVGLDVQRGTPTRVSFGGVVRNEAAKSPLGNVDAGFFKSATLDLGASRYVSSDAGRSRRVRRRRVQRRTVRARRGGPGQGQTGADTPSFANPSGK